MTPPDLPGLSVRRLGKTWRGATAPVLSDVDFDLEHGGRLALLGRNGQGKSTLIKILGGVLSPSRGVVTWRMSVSWPIGFGGGFQGSLSGLDNIRFIARIYDRPYAETLARVDDFAELGPALREPVKHYSSGMRARLAFGLSLAIEFDCYLIDELVAVGDARFQQKCREALFERRAERAFIMASHDMHLVAEQCDRALIIEGGRAKLFADIDEAIEIYSWLRAA
ncbi:ABC transporter ATP-binding protein [Brevundimonas vitis]|uniref:ABC transporter ATP-binding protein n=1 Tax=Brevundimonas vitisensis TaxID=2800818 RepID=A0ABX7BKC2_9CAUL|nr:ATP-binding cassette domain-containing protein [Brevundimonas vitisensis]QQQ18007.1 ABC transporter ATP-binding protein [Brevundimonas vitisensis]